MRLIDVDMIDDVVSMLNEKGRGITRHEYKVIEGVLFAFPTIDAVKVVRCGECKHMIADGRCMEFADDGIRPSASDFCSYGERREP